MKYLMCLLCMSVLFINTGGSKIYSFPSKGVNGGITCAACTFTVGLIDQLAQVHNKTITDALNTICKLLPQGPYYQACTSVFDKYGPAVIDLLYDRITPDVICHSINLCHTDPGKSFCHLFPLPKPHFKEDENTRVMTKWHEFVIEKYRRKHGFKDNDYSSEFCTIPGIKYICKFFNNFIKQHNPLLDFDEDGYSTVKSLRGTNWKGRDCNDDDSAIHPGTRPKQSDVELDSNCNGIYGIDKDGIPFEDKFCKHSHHLGIGILGDSAAAHFHIPEEWITATSLNKEVLSHFEFVIENEFDWPMMSSATGYINITWPIIQGPVHSIYTMMRNRNRCIHRDYQNLAVNGARVTTMQYHQKQLSRNQTADYPMLLFYAVVGNDVCNGHPDTLAHMTTPEEMRENIIKTLEYLDTRLPKGSHLVFIGLADGRVLYENMFRRYHPFGRINKDVKYPDFYEFLKCLEISPCNGWMTSNQTLRDLTYQRVVELNKVLQNVALFFKDKFQNYDILYLDCPYTTVIEQWEKVHGKNTGYQLIEPVDGFHPNQYAQMMIAQYTWRVLSLRAPHFLGDENPHNKEINDVFGDQGGH